MTRRIYIVVVKKNPEDISQDKKEFHSESLSGAPTASINMPSSIKGIDITLEGYHILEELPQGGQAVVYKAIHKATKMKVALIRKHFS